jgi:serine/threonine protein kinase
MPQPTLFGDYLLEELLSRDALFDVWRGSHFDSGRGVIVKRMIDTEDEELRTRLLRAGRNGARVRHAHVVETLDWGEADGLAFVVTREAPGLALDAIVARRRQEEQPLLPKSIVLRLMVQACDGATAIHTTTDSRGALLGFVHRMLTPHHMLVGFDGRLRIFDFFASQLANRPRITAKGVLLGCVGEMAPEQVRGETLDARADVFVLGVTLYELLVGEPAFPGDELMTRFDKNMNCTFTAPRQLRPDVPEALEAIVLRAMAKQPADRFQTAAEMGDALRALRDAEGFDQPDSAMLAAFMAAGFSDDRARLVARRQALAQ